LEAIKRKDRELHGLFRRQVHRAYEATARRIPRADKLIAVLAFSYRTLVHLHTILETSYTTAARGYTYLPVRHDIEPGQQMHVLRCLKGFWWLACGADSDYVKREYLRPAADALGIGDMPHLASNGPTKGPGDAAFEGALQWLSASQAGARAYLALRQLEEIGPLFCRLARARPGPPTVRAVNRLFSDFAMELSARDIAHRVAGTRGVTLMLVHDAKNREFDGACVVIEPGELKGDDANQRLYVACTRARYWTSLVFHPKFSLPGPWNTLSRYALPLGGR
jgi:hypothetical protein